MAKTKFTRDLIFIVVLGLTLRLINIGQSFWLDEASQAQMSSLSLFQIWSGRAGDFHPPLFYFLSHYWQLISKTETWLRLPSVIFGLINVFLVYIFAKKLFPEQKIKFGRWLVKIETVAGLLLAINPYSIYYSQEYRSYSLLGLLGTWSMYLLFTQNYFWLTIANIFLVYTHYSSVFLILTQLVFVTIYQKQNLSKYLNTLVFTFIIYLPWIPQLFRQIQSGINIDSYLPGWRQLLSVSAIKILPLTLFKQVAGRITFISAPIYLIYFILVLTVIFLIFRFADKHRNFLFTWVILPIFIMILTSGLFPQNQPFRVIYILSGLILIFTQAIVRFPKLFLTLLIYIALVGNLAYFTRPRLQREQWRQALVSIQSEMSASDLVVVKFSDKFSTINWYAPNLPVLAAVPSFPAKPEEVAHSLYSLSQSDTRQIYLLDYLGDLTDPKREVDLALTNLGYIQQKTYDFPGVGFIHVLKRI